MCHIQLLILRAAKFLSLYASGDGTISDHKSNID